MGVGVGVGALPKFLLRKHQTEENAEAYKCVRASCGTGPIF